MIGILSDQVIIPSLKLGWPEPKHGPQIWHEMMMLLVPASPDRGAAYQAGSAAMMFVP